MRKKVLLTAFIVCVICVITGCKQNQQACAAYATGEHCVQQHGIYR